MPLGRRLRLEPLEDRRLLSLGDFSILSPGGVIDDATPEITWQASAGAYAYDVVVDDDPGLSSPLVEASAVVGTSLSLADPLGAGTYYLGVTARENLAPQVDAGADSGIDEGSFLLGFGSFTDPDATLPAANQGLSFTVVSDIEAPGPFDITAPSGVLTIQTPQVIWQASTGADAYDLVIASDAACTVPIQSYSDLTATSLVLPVALEDGDYFIGVIAKNIGGTTAATNNGLAFSIGASPPAPFSITGPSGTIDVSAPEVVWEAAAGASTYDLIVSTLSDCSIPTQEALGLTDTVYTLLPLADGTYFICVTAEDDAGNTSVAENNGLSFVIDTTPATIHKMFATSFLSGLSSDPIVPPVFPDFGGLDAADWTCTFAAASAGMVENWNGIDSIFKSVLSINGNNARDRINITGPVFNTNGDLLANDAADLWDGMIQAPVGYDEQGNAIVGSEKVWTGTSQIGTSMVDNCLSWLNPSNGSFGRTGSAIQYNARWISETSQVCDLTARLYGVSPPIHQLVIAGMTGPGAPTGTELDGEMLQDALAQAMAYWAGMGLADIPESVRLGVTSLAGPELSNSYVGLRQVVFDADAAGWGWYSSSHPGPLPVEEAERIDLLSAMVHEVGHLLGLEHADQAAYDVMASRLEPGVRPAGLDAWASASATAWSGEVDYGDGTGQQPLHLNDDGSFGLAHQYTDNGQYTVIVTVTDAEGNVASDTRLVTVNNVAPSTQLLTADEHLDEGGTFSATGAFADPGADTWTVEVDYGDGSPTETVAHDEDHRYELSHAYDQQGQYTVVVTVTDDEGDFGQTGRIVNVYNVVPEITSVEVAPAVIDEGQSVEVSGSFTDPGADDTHVATVNWGDGTEGPATIDPLARTFSAQHTYADDPAGVPDVYEITVSLRDTDTVVPAGFVEFGGHAYGRNDRAVCWKGVEADAQALSGALVTIDSAEEQAFLVHNILTDEPLWTGLHDFDDEGNFHWIGQEPLTYNNWAPGEPAAGEDFSYVLMDPAGTWRAVGVWGDGGHYGVVEIVAYDEARIDVTVHNVAPRLDDATFEVVENSPEGTVVGTVTGTDPGADVLSYSIPEGTPFVIDPDTGQISVAPEARLDYEATPVLTLAVTVDDGDGGTDTALVTINLLNQASITGVVFVDVNQDGEYDANEPGIDGVTVELLDADGNLITTTTTSDGGFYLFDDLDPAVYQLHEVQPTGVDDGEEILGSLEDDSIVANDTMELSLARIDAADYLFAELGQEVTSGDTATIGFWQNKHGQELIAQGGAALAAWLTDNLGNVFGNTFSDGDGSDDGLEVAAFFKDQLFRQKSLKSAGPAKVDAQFMAVALATYFTNESLAGSVAADYGFNVTDTGIGTRIVNVGDHGEAFDAHDGTDWTIMQLLRATNALTDNLGDGSLSGFAHIYDLNGDGVIDSQEAALRAMANDVYSMINQQGDE